MRQEPCVGVRQEVVNGVSLRDRTIVLDGVDVVISRSQHEAQSQGDGLQRTGVQEEQQAYGA